MSFFKYIWGNKLFLLGVLIRTVLMFYSEYQDRMYKVKYTDIDYSVYNDAAKEVYEGHSPYDRHTYRYTPLLAYLLLPNQIIWANFGKALFIFSDILCAHYIKKILRITTKKSDQTIDYLTALWVFNPVVFNVSTRGNADTLISLMVLAAMYELLKKNIIKASVLYGLSAHFKIYPLLYALPIYFYIDSDKPRKGIFSIFSKNRILFTLISASIFIGFFALFYVIYGWEFAYEAYFYHIIRKDNRHNFSIYFYYLYLNFGDVKLWQSILTFLPQITLLAYAGYKYYKDLPFCFFVQTFIFVIFNKVCTAQYFIWYMVYFPFVYKNNMLYKKHKILLLAMWIIWLAVELSWNYFSYRLEMLGQNVFLEIWLVCIAFFLVNVFIICIFIKYQKIKKFKTIRIKKE